MFYIFLVCACSPNSASFDSFPGNWTPPDSFWVWEEEPRLVATQTDSSWQIGAYGVADPDGWIVEGEQTHSDSVAKCAGNWLLVINRYMADNLQFIDINGITVAQWSVGNGSNPHDVVFYNNKAFISLYEKDYLLVADFINGREITKIDLSDWADKDGIPEAGRMFSYNGLVWVTLEQLDRETWSPYENGLLIGINPESFEVELTYNLPFSNPTGSWTIINDIAVSAAVGNYLDEKGDLNLDAGIYSIDLNNGQTEILLYEQDLGLNIFDAIPIEDGFWISAYDKDWNNILLISQNGELKDLGHSYWAGWDKGQKGIWIADHTNSKIILMNEQGKIDFSLNAPLHPSSVAACGI